MFHAFILYDLSTLVNKEIINFKEKFVNYIYTNRTVQESLGDIFLNCQDIINVAYVCVRVHKNVTSKFVTCLFISKAAYEILAYNCVHQV